MIEKWTPPAENQLWKGIHSSNLMPGAYEKAEVAIAEEGFFIGALTKYAAGISDGYCAIRRSGDFVDVIPNAVLLPYDHPVNLLRQSDYDKSERERERERGATVSRPMSQSALNAYSFEVVDNGPAIELAVGEDISSETIQKCTHINGIRIQTLEASMRPKGMFGTRFIGAKESLKSVIIQDNDTVHEMGKKHTDLAEPLQAILDHSAERDVYLFNSFAVGHNELELEGQIYLLGGESWRGYQASPFDDGEKTNKDFSVLNTTTGKRLDFSGLMPSMIRSYGFYEGNDVSYRVAPTDIAETFAHLWTPQMAEKFSPENDPIVAITSGESSAARLTSKDHIRRYLNLHAARSERIVNADIEIDLENPATALEELAREMYAQQVYVSNDLLQLLVEKATKTANK